MGKRYLEIGKIVGTHGIKGELRVEPWCDSPDFLNDFKTLYMGKEKEELTVKCRPHKNISIVTVQGITAVEQADLLRGKILYMDRNDANLGEDVFFIQDIIGLTVKDVNNGNIYGEITDVLKTGANDVYQITDSEKNNFLIPVINDVVKEVNIEQGFVAICPIKGIFEDED